MYTLRVEQNGELKKSGVFDLEIAAIDYSFKLSRIYMRMFPEKEKHFKQFNYRETAEIKLNCCSFVQMWSLEDIKCYIIKG